MHSFTAGQALNGLYRVLFMAVFIPVFMAGLSLGDEQMRAQYPHRLRGYRVMKTILLVSISAMFVLDVLGLLRSLLF